MMLNKSLLDYIFKTDLKNDQSSVTIGGVVKSIEDFLKEESKVYASETNQSLALQEYSIETELERIQLILENVDNLADNIEEKIREKLVEVKLRLEESKSLVQQALLSERALIGESYTVKIPIKKEYTTKDTTATLEDGIVYGIGFNENSVKNKLDISSLQIRSEEGSSFKISSDEKELPLNIEFEENYKRAYNQIRVVVSNLTQTGILYLKFKQPEAISVLNRKGVEIIEPIVTDSLTVTIEEDTQAFSIRFANNSERIVSIHEMYFTEAIFNTTTVFETLPISLNKNLSFITVQTCDNYNSKDISINYEISINGGSYKAFRPNGKLNNNRIQSLIRTSDTFPREFKVNYTSFEKGVYKYYTEDLVTMNAKIKAYSYKMGEDFYSLESFIKEPFYTVYFYTKDNIDLILSEGMVLRINGIDFNYEKEKKGIIEIKEGFHKMEVRKDFWKEIIDLDTYEIKMFDNKSISVVKRGENKLIEVENNFNTNTLSTNSIYLQLLQKNVPIYLKEEVLKRKYDNSYVEYFYKNTNNPLYLYAEAYQTEVKTVQIKATLSTEDQKVCPYISNIILRGI